jgi:hypothetical protein
MKKTVTKKKRVKKKDERDVIAEHFCRFINFCIADKIDPNYAAYLAMGIAGYGIGRNIGLDHVVEILHEMMPIRCVDCDTLYPNDKAGSIQKVKTFRAWVCHACSIKYKKVKASKSKKIPAS